MRYWMYLGGLYKVGAFLQKDLQKSLECYLEAANWGDNKAILEVIRAYYFQGEIEKAILWVEKLPHKEKIDDIVDLKILGDIYYKQFFKVGNRENFNKAYGYLIKAANLGDQEASRRLSCLQKSSYTEGSDFY